MVKVEIYSGDRCPYCVRAKDLLKRKGVDFIEYKVDIDDARREEMLARTGGKRTIPQIFIDGEHVGGCDDLHALDSQGKLDQLLKKGSLGRGQSPVHQA